MKLESKLFDELGTRELYEILRARTAVFIVEQKCPYQDVDGIDCRSLHVFYAREDGRVEAYLRAFWKEGASGAGLSGDVVQMGRVLTVRRGEGLGGRILRDGIEQVRLKFDPRSIFIEAQCYARGFYEREGFAACSEEFLEDGIPHVGMELSLRP